ncbi:hypothetical protein GCM10007989_12070 [Devosia pacifica]|uniref:HTH cro/C1-type domain-containing protein n=1 Tax=Devosia pacifica TaxID=1335967 RepID=A0A918S0L7_9HYPH|nr:helix-turn-helix transcriptional regulator [Devosia pacifica]GHA18362.1 hypothetical protein GCM10007989_12070 [Devosia pacifica]
MYAHPQHGVDPNEVQALRRLAGRWLRDKREAARFSQRELAERLGFERYAFISQIEAGRGRVPPDRYEDYARALGVNARELARTMLRYYDPVTHRLLFETERDSAPAPASTGFDAKAAGPAVDRQIEALEERLKRLESRLQAAG